jgi:hypothetical protein
VQANYLQDKCSLGNNPVSGFSPRAPMLVPLELRGFLFREGGIQNGETVKRWQV